MKALLFYIALIWVAVPADAESQISIIVNPGSPIQTLKKAELVKIFSGAVTTRDGKSITPYDQAPGPVKQEFYQSYFGYSLDEIHDYWIREVYRGSGRRPPGYRETADDVAMRAWIAKTPNAIGYIDKSAIDSTVRPVDIQ